MQNALAQESVEYEKHGVKAVMNGNMEITQLTIAPGLAQDRLQSIVIEVINETIKRAQKTMAKKVQEMGGLGGF